MRHVSRTHRVALDGLFDRINLDSKIQIRYIDTKHRRKKCGKIESKTIYSDEPVFSCSDKFLIREKSDCIQKSGDTHSYGET